MTSIFGCSNNTKIWLSLALSSYLICGPALCQDYEAQQATQRAEDDASLALVNQMNADLDRREQLEAIRRQQAAELANVQAKVEAYRQELRQFNAAQEQQRQNELQRQRQAEIAARLAQEEQRQKELQEQQLQWQQQFEFARARSSSTAVRDRLYPDAGIPGTPLFKKINEIADQLTAESNPLALEADAPLKIAQIAATALGISPWTPPNEPTTVEEEKERRAEIERRNGLNPDKE
jgi:hypothetical protein